MATFKIFHSLTEALAEGKHDFGTDQIRVALTASANAPTAANSVLADLTEVSYANLSSRNVATASSSQTNGTYILVLTDHELSGSGGSVDTFRYPVLYNDDAPNDELIGWADKGSDVTLDDGDSFTLNFDGATGILQIAIS